MKTKNIKKVEVLRLLKELGTQTAVAKHLNVHRKTIYNILKQEDEQPDNKELIAGTKKTNKSDSAKELKLIKKDEKIVDTTVIVSTKDGDVSKITLKMSFDTFGPRSHFIVSDMQVTPKALPQVKKTLYKIAQQVKKKRPSVLIFLGDFADMESLFRASKKYDNMDSKKYKDDVNSANEAMAYFQDLIKDVKPACGARKIEQHMTLGNHEARIYSFQKNNQQVSTFINITDLNFHNYMAVHDYLKVVTIDDIQYAHKFVNGSGGADIVSARLLLKKVYGHACCGHTRKIDQFTDYKPNGKQLSTLIAGASYEHEMSYLDNPQDKLYPRQVWFCNDVSLGFNVERIDLPSLHNE